MMESEANYGKYESHGEYSELCALYPTGSLSAKELARLRQHLEICASCRVEVATARHIDQRLTLVAQAADSSSQADLLAAKQRLFAAIEGNSIQEDVPASAWQRFRESLASRWVAAPTFAALLICAIGASARAGYVVAMHRAASRPTVIAAVQPTPVVVTPDRSQPSVAEVNAQLAKITELERQLDLKDRALAEAKDAVTSATSDAAQAKRALAGIQAHEAQLADERNALVAQLNASRDRLAVLQEQAKQAEGLQIANFTESVALKRQVGDLTVRLREKDSQIQEQQTLLSSDRDIRELMGARDLFIADVFDIDRNGKTKQPFGRVFYTKSKSLIFYAFDLDKQRNLRAGVQDVAFQAWGMSDTDKRNPLNLGILYLDNAAKRRWVLRFDDPKVLDRINAVFVTVEPSGGSIKPSGKQLLFAYLEAQPNHP